ncbi:MAG: ADP-ribosylglycohydrolase family protein [Bryobacteraceae bacterium]
MLRSILLISLLATQAVPGETRKISRDELHDKIAGGWAGQMIGVSFGAPTEFRSNGQINETVLPKWTPDRVSEALNQDDLYVDMTLAKVLDDRGLNATSEDFGAMLRDAQYSLWHANLAARRNLRRGVPARLAGTPKYNAHANDIDFQIEADFIGLMAPGLYQASNRIADQAGRVMNYGDGLYGGMFVSCMYAAAFFEHDPRKVVETGLHCIPAESPYARLVRDVLAWHAASPKDWRAAWIKLEKEWDKRDPCPEGALRPFNIDAKLNGGYIVLGLLYGEGDFGKTVEIATRAGQDSDCNPASAAGIAGVMLGYRKIPGEWKDGIPALAQKKFRFTDFSFDSIVASTEKRAEALIKATGGKSDVELHYVNVQTPRAPKLEIWDDYGTPVDRISVFEKKKWAFTGPWADQRLGKQATQNGAEAEITFKGTGAIVVGGLYTNGGKIEVLLDGRLDKATDTFSDDLGNKNHEAIWHKFGLKNGEHTIRVIVKGEPFGGSGGSLVSIEDLVVFRP